jgi:Glycosyltransferase family 87
VWLLVGLAFVFECFRDAQRAGDFIGYVNAGNSVLNGNSIYTDYLNTWPPFFSIFCVPLAWLDNFSPILVRSIWLIGIGIAWVGIMRLSSRIFLNRRLVFSVVNPNEISWTDWKILLPFLLVFRFVIDDLANIQINSYMLLACLVVIDQIERGKFIVPSLILAFIISLKVYPVFLLLFLVWKRHWHFALYTTALLVMINGISFLVFGWEGAIANYAEWVETRLTGPIILHYKNQSIFPLMAGLFSDVTRGLEIKFNVLSLDLNTVKKLTLVLMIVTSSIPLWNMKGSMQKTSAVLRKWEWAMVLAVIPIFSPLAWKYYFVFLLPIYIQLLMAIRSLPSFKTYPFYLFVLSVILTILTTDGLIGTYYSDVFEIFGCITVGTIILLGLGWHFHSKIRQSSISEE